MKEDSAPRELFGMRLVVDESMPPGEFRIVSDKQIGIVRQEGFHWTLEIVDRPTVKA